MYIDFINNIISLFKNNIIPTTQENVKFGNKIFGAAIVKKKDFSLVTVGANNEIENPLWHGEISTIKKFYEIKEENRPLTKDCYFISSHEPCSLCLSAITWCGFDNFYYLFPYIETKNKHSIPHDLNILREVFNIKNGAYKNDNYYWKANNINHLVDKIDKNEKIKRDISEIKNVYEILSEDYQLSKKNNIIPLK